MSNQRRVHSGDWKRKASLKIGSIRLPKAFVKNAILVLGVLLAAGSIGVLGLFAYVSRDLPDPNSLTDRAVSQTTKIYDRTGEHLLYEIYGEENRTLVKFQEGLCKDATDLDVDPNGIPLRALQATIAAEDHAFCSHHGISYKGLLRAALFGGSRGGGSTLTQQLVKNAILTNERTLTRKVKELILSIELERRYAKDEILQIYFNEIPYGSTFYGIGAAAQNYFGKSTKDLTLGEIATLAALPQLPTFYLNNPDRLKIRRDFILDEMTDLDFISLEEATEAKNFETPVKSRVSNIKAPHFVEYVKVLLAEKFGTRQVEEGGFRVLTSLDFDKQVIAEEEVVKGVEERGEQYGFNDAALVAIDPKNGHILAMVGSADYFNNEINGKVNVALRPRQPGSSFKPIVFAKAFEAGYTPNTILWDVRTDFPTETGTYSPNNYDLGERGPIRMREALQGSLNIPAVKTVYLAGVEASIAFAERLGYTTFGDRSRFGFAIVLGGAEVKLLEHTAAYAAFANDGVRHDTVAILKIEDASGNVIEEWKAGDGIKVMEPNVARTITDVLADNNARAYVFGLTSYVQLGARPVAAKTGTTNDYHDGWTMGYTRSLAVGVWTGNADLANTAMKKGADGSKIAAPIWNGFMKRALDKTPVESFIKPEIKITGKPVLDGQLPATTVTIDTFSGKLATEFTPPSMREERKFAQYHEILQFIKRSDPLGAPPEDPTKDSQYAAWEKGVADWIAREEIRTGIKVTNAVPPTEFDDVHLPANLPSVEIVTPFENEEFGTRDIHVAVNASAPRGVSRVELYLDGFYLGTDTHDPYELTVRIPNTVSRGFHTLKAIAYDDVDNAGSDTVGIRLSSDAAAATFSIIDPKNGQTIEQTGRPFSVAIELQNPTSFARILAYAKPVGAGDRQSIGVKSNPDSPFITFDWTVPVSGDWVLSAVAEPNTGSGSIETSGVLVHVSGSAGSPPPPTPPAAGTLPPVIPNVNLNPFATP